jgi:hypothetical protein
LNFRPEARKELLSSRASVSGTAARTKKKELTTDPDVELEGAKQQTMKVTDLGKLTTPDTEETIPNMTAHANKDFAESIRFLQMEE